MNKKNRRLIIPVILLTAFTVIIISLLSGSADIVPSELISSLFKEDITPEKRIFIYSRLPRTIACILSGAGLATAGGLIQQIFSNRLASPGIIGVNAGAGLGVTICCAFGLVGGWAVSLASFTGALICVMLVAFISRLTGASRTSVILSGVALNSFLSSISQALKTLSSDVAVLSADFYTGGFSGVTFQRIIPAGIMIIISLIIAISMSNELDVLSMGEDTAKGLGLCVKKTRTAFLILSAFLAGASVSFAGLLGFVGLIIPNIVKKIFSGNGKRFLIMCSVCGAIFVTFCDCIARVIFSPHEIPTGIILSAIGAPFFMIILFKSKGGHHHG